MNLHGIASGAIGAVNPFVSAQISKSTGYTTASDGSRTPAYAAAVTQKVQQQALTQKELEHMSGMNVQGVMCKAYVKGQWYGVDRKAGDGGDLFVIGADTWLVVEVLEVWPDWSAVVLNKQLT